MTAPDDRPSLARIAFEAWWAADTRWRNAKLSWEYLSQEDMACWEAVANAVSGALVREDRMELEELRERIEELADQHHDNAERLEDEIAQTQAADDEDRLVMLRAVQRGHRGSSRRLSELLGEKP